MQLIHIKVLRIFISAGLLFFIINNSSAQDFQKDLKKVINNMMPLKGVSQYNMAIKYYKNSELKTASDSIYGKYQFCRNSYFIEMNGVQTCQDEKLMVSVNKKDRVIIVSESRDLVQLNFNYLLLDSILTEHNYKITFEKNKEELIYNIKPTLDGDFDSLLIKIEPNRMIFKQVLVCFRKDFRINEEFEYGRFLSMDYYQYNFKEESSENNQIFNTNNYFIIKNNKLIPTKEYENFRIINNLANQDSTN